MLPNQFLELLYRYTSRPITSFLHRRAESVRSSSQPLVVCAGTSALELSRAGSGLMTRLVSGAEVRTREGRVEEDTARTQAPSPTSSSARRRRRRPAGARSRGRTGPIVVVKSRGISLGNRPSRGVSIHTPRDRDRPTDELLLGPWERARATPSLRPLLQRPLQLARQPQQRLVRPARSHHAQPERRPRSSRHRHRRLRQGTANKAQG